MVLTFTGSDAEKQAKLKRIQTDIETVNGVKFAVPLTYDNAETALNRALDSKGLPHTNDQEATSNLRKAALDEVLGANDSARAQQLRIFLSYMGYSNDSPVMDGTYHGLRKAEAGLDNFIKKHPEYNNLSANDLLAKVGDALWNEQQQPGVDSYRRLDNYDGPTNPYADELRRSAEASFGGPEGVRAVQAQLYMRDPAHSKKPDGVWSPEDQQALIKFRKEENAHLPPEKQIPDLIEMRWAGPVPDSNPPIADRQKDMGARITSALTVSQANWANWNGQNDRKDPTKLLTIPTRADGTSNPQDIAQLQAILKITKSYKDNDMPTGQWTQRDQDALQGYLNKHKGLFTWNDMPSKVDNMTGKDFQEILKYGMDQVKDDYGMTPALFAPNPQTGNSALVATNQNILQPAPRTAVPTPTPVATPTTTPAAKPTGTPTPTPTPKGSEPDVPHKVNANANIQKGGGIADNDVAKMQAQLNLMGYYNGQINGKATDTDAALKDYATKKHIDLHGKSIDDHDVRLQLRAAVQKDWDAFARVNAPALQAELDAGHAVPQSHKKSDASDAVKQMQVVALAAGGKLPDFGVDGVRWHETDTAYKAVTDANHHLIVQPATSPTTTTPTPTVTAKPTPVAKPVIDDDDPIGAGGFITPPDHYNVAPTPEPVATPTPTPVATPTGNADFSRTGDPLNGKRSPVVTGNDIGSGRSSGLSDYYNGQSRADHGSASSFFQKISTPYINELGNNRGWPLEMLPYAKDSGIPRDLSGTFKHDQGQAFLTGPDGRFAAQYAMNGGKLTYVTTYDLDDPTQNQAYQAAKVQAERQNAKGPGAVQNPDPYSPGNPYPEGGTRVRINIGGIFDGGRGRDRDFDGGGWRGGPWRGR